MQSYYYNLVSMVFFLSVKLTLQMGVEFDFLIICFLFKQQSVGGWFEGTIVTTISSGNIMKMQNLDESLGLKCQK